MLQKIKNILHSVNVAWQEEKADWEQFFYELTNMDREDMDS